VQAYVAVVGPGADVDEATLAVAREVGRLLAEGGAVLLTGGLGGVMAAASEGCAHAGGLSVALLPGDDRAASVAPATVTLSTGMGEMRNALLVRAADAVVCVGGSWGTLTEVALARRTGVPVVCVRGWHILDDRDREQALVRAGDATEAVRLALAAAAKVR
jgi:uncharacterized protein (TIGR00725 family)